MTKKIILFFLLISIIVAGIILYKNRRSVPYLEPVKTEVSADKIIDSSGVIQSYFFGFEAKEDLSGEINLSSDIFLSGKSSLKIESKDEYSATFIKKISDIGKAESIKKIDLTLNYYSGSKIENAKAVISIEDPAGKTLEWFGQELGQETGSWQKLVYSVIPKAEVLQNQNKVKVYLWNEGRANFHVDEMKIIVSGFVRSTDAGNSIPVKNSNFSFDFENDTSYNTSTEVIKSGKKSFYFDPSPEFGPAIARVVGDLCNDTMKYISASVWVYPLEDDPELYIVATMDDKDGKQLEWKGRSTKNLGFQKGKWKKLLVKLFENYPNTISSENSLKIYLWNKSKSKLYVDDFEISVGCNLTFYGSGEGVNMMSHRFDSLSIPRNQYPLPISYLKKDNIGTGDSIFLTPDHKGRLTPSDEIFTGNFINDNNETDEVLQIDKENKINLFSYCESTNQFRSILESKANFNAANPRFLKGHFNSINEQVLCFDLQGRKIDQMYFEGNNSSLCSADQVNVETGEVLTDKSTEGIEFDKNNKWIAANIFGDTKQEIICFCPKGNKVLVYSLKGNQMMLERNVIPGDQLTALINEKQFSCTAIPQKEGYDKLLAIGQSSFQHSKVVILDFNVGKNNFSIGDITSEAKEFVHAGDIILPGNWQSEENIFLSYSRTWRNEFKLSSLIGNLYNANASLDFSNYAGNKNPKFYECVKVFPFSKGKNKKLSLLALLYNCDDKDYNGGPCKNYEEASDIPNSIELFNF